MYNKYYFGTICLDLESKKNYSWIIGPLPLGAAKSIGMEIVHFSETLHWTMKNWLHTDLYV